MNLLAVAAADAGGNTAGLSVRVRVGGSTPRRDCNGDGKADILLRHPASGEVYLWLMK